MHQRQAAIELHIRDISKTYPNGVQALKDVTLTIPAGMYGLLGPNGVGESTLTRMVATLQQTEAGTWQVTLDVRARKRVVDSAGVETGVPMDDWVQIAVEESGKPLHLQMHRIRSGEQTITVTVPRKPTRAGIDPNYLLTI